MELGSEEAANRARVQAREVVQLLGSDDEMSRTILNSRLLSHALLDSSDAISVRDLDGTVLGWNRGATRLYGLSEVEAQGMDVRALIPPDRRGEEQTWMEQLSLTGSVQDFETQRLTRDGRRVDVLLSARLVSDESEVPSAIAVTERDITERKRSREGLRMLAAELARVNDELSRQNACLDEFTYVVSHDLKAPLRTILGCCELAQEALADPEVDSASESLGRALAAARRMGTLISDLLEYSRLGRTALDLGRVDLNDVVDEAMANLEGAIRDANASIEVGTLPVLLADRTRMVQLFQNLLGNAIKFVGETAPVIRISARVSDFKWHVSVEDNGRGIDPKNADRVFRAFQRVHKPSEHDGTGIGLSICKKIVESHDGRIWLDSTPGEGSTFHMFLPANEPVPEKPDPEEGVAL